MIELNTFILIMLIFSGTTTALLCVGLGMLLSMRKSPKNSARPAKRDNSMWYTEYTAPADPLDRDFQVFLATVSPEKDDFQSALKVWHDYLANGEE